MLAKGIYKLLEKDENGAVVKLSDETHPLFQAHFPNMPILPGYIYFDMAAEIFNITLTTIKRAKFLKTVKPNQILRYEKKNNKFKIFCENEEIANFTL